MLEKTYVTVHRNLLMTILYSYHENDIHLSYKHNVFAQTEDINIQLLLSGKDFFSKSLVILFILNLKLQKTE